MSQIDNGDSSSSLRRAARGSILNIVGSIVAGFATFGLTIVVTRLSSSTDAGLFFSATSLFILATGLGRLGTNTGLVYFISGARATGKPEYSRVYMRVAATPVLVVATAMAVILFFWAEPIADLVSPERASEFADFIRVMSPFVPLAAVANLAIAGTQGLGTMKIYVLMDQVLRPLLQLVAVLLALLLVGTHSLSAAWSSAYLPVAVLSWICWHRLQNSYALPVVEQPSVGRAFWRFTSPRALASVSQVAMQRLDIILVGALAGLTQAAIYAAATRFLVLGQMAGRAVSLSVQPLLGEALARRDLNDAGRLYQVCTAWLVLAVWPIYLVLIGFAEVLLQVFGDDYQAAADILLLLCSAMLFATACGTVDMVLNMAGKSLWNLMNVLIAFITNIGLDLLLIPEMGMMGAAIGWAAAIVVANLLPLVQILYSPGLHPFGRSTLLAMGAATTCFGVLPWIARLLSNGNSEFTLIGLGVTASLYLVALVFWRDTFELGLLVTSIRRRRRN